METMQNIYHPEYLVDEKNHKKAVLLPMKVWEKILAALEELDDITEYDKIKARPSEPIPFEHAVKEIKNNSIN